MSRLKDFVSRFRAFGTLGSVAQVEPEFIATTNGDTGLVEQVPTGRKTVTLRRDNLEAHLFLHAEGHPAFAADLDTLSSLLDWFEARRAATTTVAANESEDA